MGKNLDAELAEVAGLGDESPASGMTVPASAAPNGGGPSGPPSGPGAPKEPPRRGNIGLLAALLTMVGAIVLLFVFGLKEAPIYAMSLEDFMSKRDEIADRRIRIDGELVPGSLVKRDKPCEFRFMLREPAKKEAAGKQAGKNDVPHLEIRFPQCIVPDTFRDMPEGGVLVTAEGSMQADGYFEANEIMAKCSSKYNPDTHELEGAPKQAQVDDVL